MEHPTPVEPTVEDDLRQIEDLLEGQDRVPVSAIAPVLRRVVAEMRRLLGENRKLLDRLGNLQS